MATKAIETLIFSYELALALILPLALVLSCGSNANELSTTKTTTQQNQSTLKDSSTMLAPVAKLDPKAMTIHGQTRIDPYFWMNDKDNPAVIDYLKSENAYVETVLKNRKDLQETIYTEIVQRIKDEDQSVPYPYDDYFYYHEYVAGNEYPTYLRKKGSLDALPEIYLDPNPLAINKEVFNIGDQSVSTNHQILAYSIDDIGDRIYTIYFKDLKTGTLLPDTIPQTSGSFEWANDNRTLYYTKNDPKTLRSFQVYKHVLGTQPETDLLIYEEMDDTYNIGLDKTNSKKYIILYIGKTESSEIRLLDADHLDQPLQVMHQREPDHLYDIDHVHSTFFIVTNKNAYNYRLMKTLDTQPSTEHWKEVIPQRQDVLLEDMLLLNQEMILVERKDGLIHLRVLSYDQDVSSSQATHAPTATHAPKTDYYIPMDEPVYSVWLAQNYNLDTHQVRFSFESLTTPYSTYDFNLRTHEKVLLKQEEILGGFNSSDYVSERVFVKSSDGVSVPVSLVYRNDFKKDGSHPCLVTGYGSYGISTDVYFSIARLSLLNRGFVIALAHVRGGQELGRSWYDDGKLLKKKNTFTDFIACSEWLCEHHYTQSDRLFAYGASAGGMLMGVLANERPDLYKGLVLDVPFLDVLTTMLDDSLPLTTFEYEEWGNPNDPVYYDYIASYSPYDNIKKQMYPNMLVTTGLNDTNVSYWEPAKWVAKIRSMKTDQNLLLFKTNMETGHGGASGRYKPYKDTALMYTFLLSLLEDHKQ